MHRPYFSRFIGFMIVIVLCSGFMSCGNADHLSPRVSEKLVTFTNTGLKPELLKDLDSLNVFFQLTGDCFAYSSAVNAEESNGEAHSDNVPKKTDEHFHGTGLYLYINEGEHSVMGNHLLGRKLYLVNKSGDKIKLRASDSRLNIIAEAMDEKSEWYPITWLPSSDCGNSYHNVILDNNEYWTFDIPVFKGNFKTKTRYLLLLDQGKTVVSNEIAASINKEQMNSANRQGVQSGEPADF